MLALFTSCDVCPSNWSSNSDVFFAPATSNENRDASMMLYEPNPSELYEAKLDF